MPPYVVGPDGRPVPTRFPPHMPPGHYAPPPPGFMTYDPTQSTEARMSFAADQLQTAALATKRRRCMVAVDEVPGFVRTVYTLLRVCDPEIIRWTEDGNRILIKAPDRFAAEICPKFFRHRNFNSFTRLLNMYQFHKVPSTQRDCPDVCFEHKHFKRDRNDLLPLVQRKGAQSFREEARQPPPRGFPQPPPGVNPAQWTRRMAELEEDVKALRAENDRLRKFECERAALRCQVRSQEDLINVLQVASGNAAALAANSPAQPGAEAAAAFAQSAKPPPPEVLREALNALGGGVMMANMISVMANAMQQGISSADDEAAAAAASDPVLDAATAMAESALGAPAKAPLHHAASPALAAASPASVVSPGAAEAAPPAKKARV